MGMLAQIMHRATANERVEIAMIKMLSVLSSVGRGCYGTVAG